MTTIASIILSAAIAVPPPTDTDARAVLDAIRAVESGGIRDAANAVGDNGRALGPYQIHEVYWRDAVQYDKTLVSDGQTYQSVRDRDYAERVIVAYWSRYAPNWTPETLARVHNGGPSGARKSATLKYWRKVKERLVPQQQDGQRAVPGTQAVRQ
jgi:hypothetical protein